MKLFITPSLCENLPSPGEENAFTIYGTEPVLITSVHGVAHTRLGATKPADRGTFEFGHLVARSLGGIFFGQWALGEADSNHRRDTLLKKKLAILLREHAIKMSIDMHSSHPARPYDIELGTRSGRSLLGNNGFSLELEKSFALHHLACATDQYFKAEGIDGGETITEFVSTILHTPAIQLEISASIISGDGGVVGYHARSKVANAIASAWFKFRGDL